ncbi:MAG TPA: hypothetical protein VEI95_17425 [Acidobacteriota bacterium]|nr:hypothetical protein [Acidobacteriota bacterium]
MDKTPRHLGIFLLALVVGTLYAVTTGMIATQLRAALIGWPIQILFFWALFGRFKLIRFVGFILVPPVLLIGFQLYWSARHPGLVADKYVAYDRSHYVPGTRVKSTAFNQTDPDATGWNVAEIFIGADGFRADPTSDIGNPKICHYVLIGDSMIYGSGLVYSDTFGPVLKEMGVEACVFGVTGNSPADYLSTLQFVADRIAPGAYVAFYIYAYNDFVSLSKYFTRRARGYATLFPTIAEWTHRFDLWRRSTIVYAWFHAPRSRPVLKPWHYPVAAGKQIKLFYASDPQNYDKPRSLDSKQKDALKFFFDGVTETATGHNWRIAMLIHPDHSEIYANLARGAKVLQDLDPRRANALAMCRSTNFICEDISAFIYDKTISEGKDPYFTDDRHFSRFGTRVVAENFVELAKPRADAARKISWDTPLK